MKFKLINSTNFNEQSEKLIQFAFNNNLGLRNNIIIEVEIKLKNTKELY